MARGRVDVEAPVRRFVQAVSGTPLRVTVRDDSKAGAKGFDRVFVQVGLTLDSLPAIMRGVGTEAIRAEFARNFDEQTGRTRWARLAPATLRDRARRGYGSGPILQRTGQLRRHVLAAAPQITSGGGRVTLRIAPSPNVGGRPKYRALALGTRNMPGRPMVVLRPAASNRVTSAISREARRRAAANGLG